MDRGIVLRTLLALVLLAGAVAVFAGACDPVLEWAQRHPLGEPAEEYLDRSLERATLGFLTVSAIKGAFAVIEGSEVSATLGVGAAIEVGDAIQPAYDYVDLAWRTLFSASAVLLGLKVLLVVALRFAAVAVGVAMVVAAIAVIGPRQRWLARHRNRTGDLLRTLVVAVLVLVYVVPGAVLGASHLSASITSDMIGRAESDLEEVRVLVDPPVVDDRGLLDRAREARGSFDVMIDQVRDQGRSLFEAALRLIVGYLFDCVVFPLGLTWFGLRLARWIVGYTLTEARWERAFGGHGPDPVR